MSLDNGWSEILELSTLLCLRCESDDVRCGYGMYINRDSYMFSRAFMIWWAMRARPGQSGGVWGDRWCIRKSTLRRLWPDRRGYRKRGLALGTRKRPWSKVKGL
jgi:hypothetical protein